MKTLKFRIWNTRGSCFYTDSHVKANFFNFIENMPDEPIMQSTGLLDPHGKEIYEGDIVCMKNVNYKMIKEVGWKGKEDGFFEIFWSEETASFHKKELQFRELDIGTYLWVMGTETLEIIGNIYENPKLLETMQN